MSGLKEKYDKMIEEDMSLFSLLKNKEVGPFSNFSKGEYSEEFKHYIKDEYYGAFKEIYNKYDGRGDQTILNALIRSVEDLASKETQDLIVNDLEVTLERTLKNMNLLKGSVAKDTGWFLNESLANKSLGEVSSIFNSFSNYPSVKEYKHKIVGVAMNICDMVAQASPKNEPSKFALYNILVGKLGLINDLGEEKERFDRHTKKASRKNTGVDIKSAVMLIIGALFVLLKLLAIFA